MTYYLSRFSSVALVLSFVLGASAQAEAEKVASLRTAASQVDRIKLLQDNEVRHTEICF